MSASDSTHWDSCWQVHDGCALAWAKRVLEADQSTPLLRGLLITINYGISDHAAGECCAPPEECLAVEVARRVITSDHLGQGPQDGLFSEVGK